MGAWSANSKTHVSTMDHGDFFTNEKSVTVSKAGDIKIEFIDNNGNSSVLKEKTTLLAGEVIDATIMSKKALLTFLQEQINDAKEKNVLFSLHMKATMMKISDPIIFGHAVEVFFKDVFEKYKDVIKELEVDVNNGFGDLIKKMKNLTRRSKICYGS